MLQQSSLTIKKDYAQWEKEVQKVLEDLDAAVKVVQKYEPSFQKELEITYVLSIADDEEALLTFCITYKGSIGFIVSRSNGIQSVDMPSFKIEELNQLLFKPNEQGSITGGWVENYWSYLNAPEIKRYDAIQTLQKTLNNVLFSIGNKLLYPLLEKLPPHTKKLILLPSAVYFCCPYM